MTPDHDAPDSPSALQLTLLDAVIAGVARAHRLNYDDRQDFAQTVHLRLAERRYDVFDRFAGRSSLRTFLGVVVTRMLIDWRHAQCGKWRPSAEARRRGTWAVELERLIFRDGYQPAEAITRLRQSPQAPDAEALVALFTGLPVRHRRVFSALSSDVADWRIEDYAESDERRRRRRQASMAVARALRRLSPADRRLIGLRYVRGESFQTIAAATQVEPKVLYRRVERVMRSLRAAVNDTDTWAA